MTHLKNIVEISKHLEFLIQQDPGKRGLPEWAVQGELLPAAESLLKGSHVLIATGFYILKSGAIETDGPPGALILAETLVKSGIKASVAFDDHSLRIMKAGGKAIDGNCGLISMPVKGAPATDLLPDDISHFVALERPGRAADGGYYNFRGFSVADFHVPLDDYFMQSGERGFATIAIGDGGNELGMGRVASAVDAYVPFDRPFSCRTNSDYTVCAGVSNWAGYAFSALISVIKGRNFMPDSEQLSALIDSIVHAGAVDGVSGLAESTVDGLDPSWEKNIYEECLSVVKNNI